MSNLDRIIELLDIIAEQDEQIAKNEAEISLSNFDLLPVEFEPYGDDN